MRTNHASPVLRLLGGAAALGGALAAYTFLVEPRWLQLTRPVVRLPGLHPGLDGLRIALLTDLHLGEGTSRALVRRACRMAMAERPHLVALTGDFIADSACDFSAALEAVSALSAPLGVYAVPGNHDHVVGIDAWRRQFRDHPVVQDLTNRAVLREHGGARVCVVGVDDLTEGEPSIPRLPPPEERDFTLLLAHNPDQAEQARRVCDAVDLVVSGHTHGGQFRLPGVGPLAKPRHSLEVYDQGLKRRPWTLVYTSRGVGTVHLPGRLFCRPEVAVLRVSCGGDAESGAGKGTEFARPGSTR